MKTLSMRAVTVLAAAALVAACTAMAPAGNPADLNGTAWVLGSLGGQPPVAGTAPTARFESGRVLGTDGCNRYSAPYTATGSALEVGPRGIATQMACAPAVMKQAEAFMGALNGARSFRVAGDRLELLAPGGAVLAAFTAQRQSLAGTSWRVTGHNNGRQAVVSTITGTTLTMAFSDDGRVSGSGGCNNFNAAYRLDGEKLEIGPAAATRRMCASPERIMEQEQEFLQALETVATARFEGDRLELRTAAGALAATLSREPAK